MPTDIYPALRIELKDGRVIIVGPAACKMVVGVARWIVLGALVALGHLPPWSGVVEAIGFPWR